MTFSLTRAAICVFLGLGAACAEAQTANPFAALSLPEGLSLRCRVVANDAATAQGGRHTYVFEIGEPALQFRSITVKYDSAGAALTLIEHTTPSKTEFQSLMHAATASFHNGDVDGFFIVSDGAAGSKPAPTEPPKFSDAQRRDALRLAPWLWARRCGPR